MTQALKRHLPRLQNMVAASIILHISVLVLLPKLAGFQWHRPRVSPVYYVELVNLPVAEPQASAPAAEAAPKAVPAPPKPKAVRLPTPTVKQTKTRQDKSRDKAKEAASERNFQERLAALQKNADASHEQSTLDALRKKMTKATAGMPAATGKQAGSDYASYLRSRLTDAFRDTIALQTKSPEVIVRITVSPSGHVLSYKIERSSGDRMFENAVARAITLAERHFPPPPGKTEFSAGFVFKPENIVAK